MAAHCQGPPPRSGSGRTTSLLRLRRGVHPKTGAQLGGPARPFHVSDLRRADLPGGADDALDDGDFGIGWRGGADVREPGSGDGIRVGVEGEDSMSGNGAGSSLDDGDIGAAQHDPKRARIDNAAAVDPGACSQPQDVARPTPRERMEALWRRVRQRAGGRDDDGDDRAVKKQRIHASRDDSGDPVHRGGAEDGVVGHTVVSDAMRGEHLLDGCSAVAGPQHERQGKLATVCDESNGGEASGTQEEQPTRGPTSARAAGQRGCESCVTSRSEISMATCPKRRRITGKTRPWGG